MEAVFKHSWFSTYRNRPRGSHENKHHTETWNVINSRRLIKFQLKVPRHLAFNNKAGYSLRYKTGRVNTNVDPKLHLFNHTQSELLKKVTFSLTFDQDLKISPLMFFSQSSHLCSVLVYPAKELPIPFYFCLTDSMGTENKNDEPLYPVYENTGTLILRTVIITYYFNKNVSSLAKLTSKTVVDLITQSQILTMIKSNVKNVKIKTITL